MQPYNKHLTLGKLVYEYGKEEFHKGVVLGIVVTLLLMYLHTALPYLLS